MEALTDLILEYPTFSAYVIGLVGPVAGAGFALAITHPGDIGKFFKEKVKALVPEPPRYWRDIQQNQ